MIKKLVFIFLSISSLGMFSTQVNAAMLNVDAGGNLLGAFDIDVGGNFYNVEFLGGSCVEVFNPCNSSAIVPFSGADLGLATMALFTDVFVDGPLGAFDSNPALTFGCEDPTICTIFTPVSFDGLSISVAFPRNSDEESNDDLLLGFILGGVVTTISDTGPSATYARWTPVNPIPIPAAFWLFGTALIGLVGFSKRRKVA